MSNTTQFSYRGLTITVDHDKNPAHLRSDGEAYVQRGTDQFGNTVSVTWLTTAEWDERREAMQAAQRVEEASQYGEEPDQDDVDLVAKHPGCEQYDYCESEEHACNWDEIERVGYIDGEAYDDFLDALEKINA